jgi:FkbM family methyltransferase
MTLLRKILDFFLKGYFRFVKSEEKKSKTLTMFSRLLYDKNNTIIYNKMTEYYWLKAGNQYLYAVKNPYFNYSKERLYNYIVNLCCVYYTPKENDVIVDIGTGIGTELVFYNDKTKSKSKIYCIEANPTSCDLVKELCILNDFKNCHIYNIGITNNNGAMWIENNEDYQLNRLNTNKHGIEIATKTLDQFVKENGVTHIDFLKVNIEGAELQMIEGMTNSIHLIKNIAVSCHDFLFDAPDQPIRKKMIEFLKEHNFDVTLRNTNNVVLNSWVFGTRK